MKFPLTKAERLILWNQYEILKLLDKRHADDYGQHQEALASGYEQVWDWTYGQLLAEVMPTAQTSEVLNILTMFDAIEGSLETVAYKGTKPTPSFVGFDGNNETEQMGFCHFLIEKQNKFSRWKGRSLNSHHPVLDRYRRMLDEWKVMGEPMSLTSAQIEHLAGTGR
jgi:uncharacterized protein YfbU (UPF0304 family)